MPADITRETRIFLALWRKAGRGETLPVFTLPTQSAAIAVRMAMYRAIKPYRLSDDNELVEAAAKYTVNVKDNTVTIALKVSLALAEQLLIDLDIDETELMTPDETATLDRVRLAAGLPTSTDTPAVLLTALDDPFNLKAN